MSEELLYSDVGPTDGAIALLNTVTNVGITFRDSTGTHVNPAVVSLQITDVGGNVIIDDIYLPLASRDPNPPRIINPSPGRFEFPLGLDNSSTDATKRNRTTCPIELLFLWRARTIAPVKASATIDPAGLNNAIVWTAVADGTPGNFISVSYINPGTPNASLSITKTGAAIAVNLATDGGSSLLTTANHILAAVLLNTEISDIVTTTLVTGETGAGIVTAMPSTPLIGGIDGSSELVVNENVEVITHRVVTLLPKMRLIIDKAVKCVNPGDPDKPIFLGYTDSQLIRFLRWGLGIINSYQPSGIFDFYNYPYQDFEFILIECGLMAGVMGQQLFAVDTDIPNFNDQGNTFVITHGTQLAQYLNWLAARLDHLIPIFKLNFVRSGSVHLEMGANYRIAQLLAAAPSGSLFRNLYFKGT